MGRAKEIIVRVIPAREAFDFVKKNHYSGKPTTNAYLNLGCFLDNRLHGVMQFGPPLQRSNLIGLIKDLGWNEFVELNRMAFDDKLPKNSESRCLSIALKLIKKNAPHVRAVFSFADGTQCGDGTIYRAAGFLLTQIRKNSTIYEMPDGFRFVDIGLRAKSTQLKRRVGYREGENFRGFLKRTGARPLPGFQLRYIYLIDKKCELTCPVLPYSKIDELGAGMYKGEKKQKRAAVAQSEECLTLQSRDDVRVDPAAPISGEEQVSS